MKKKSYILVTGVAGFIGSAISSKLLNSGKNVIGIDNISSYYDLTLKKDRLKKIESIAAISKGDWIFKKCDITNRDYVFEIFENFKPKLVINLAAQAGVRYSIKNPHSYIQSNILGFSNILDACINNNVDNFLYASSSSVYGLNKKIPFEESDRVDHPASLYAATKRSNELIAHTYSHVYGLPCTGMRFFTVYGPWGRPDMAPIIFTKSILENKPINVYNYGKMLRDFTYIDDVVKCISICLDKPAVFDKSLKVNSNSEAPHRIFNIGNGSPIELMEFIHILEEELGIKAKMNFQPMHKGDVKETSADIKNIYRWIDFQPKVSLKKGMKLFIKWYLDYYLK